MKRGPKVKVKRAGIGAKGWRLTLECGHVVKRPIKRQWAYDTIRWHADNAPQWVYCELCRDGERATQ